MSGYVCKKCLTYSAEPQHSCQNCETQLIYEGPDKNILDQLIPDCLVYRYLGSDKLEPAAIVKVGRTNTKVATCLKEFSHPVVVPKSQIYRFDHTTYSAIQGLRNERTSTIERYDLLIRHHWQNLTDYFSS